MRPSECAHVHVHGSDDASDVESDETSVEITVEIAHQSDVRSNKLTDQSDAITVQFTVDIPVEISHSRTLPLSFEISHSHTVKIPNVPDAVSIKITDVTDIYADQITDRRTRFITHSLVSRDDVIRCDRFINDRKRRVRLRRRSSGIVSTRHRESMVGLYGRTKPHRNLRFCDIADR